MSAGIADTGVADTGIADTGAADTGAADKGIADMGAAGDRPAKFARALPAAPRSLAARLTRWLKGRAPATLARAPMPEISDAPWGAWTPTPRQNAAIQICRRLPVLRSAARAHAALAIQRARPGPVDIPWHDACVRHYPRLTSSFRLMLLAGERYQAEEFAFLAAHMGREGAFLDIGANAGAFTFWACKQSGGAPVVAVEPAARLAAALRSNVRLFGQWCEAIGWAAPTIHVLEHALGEAEGTAAFSPGQESLLAGHDTVEVRVRPLLAVLHERGIARLSALKIDVEGYEDRVLLPFLAAAPRSLLPRAVLIEHLAQPLWRDDAIAALVRSGYRTAFTNAQNSGLVLVENEPAVAPPGA
ncbi:MAG: FkbM family methyltransferase [Pseudomonadota bacterium]